MYPKKHTGLVTRFIIVCFLLLTCVYNVGTLLMDTSMDKGLLTQTGNAANSSKPDTEEETGLERITSEQQPSQSPVRTRQKQERLLKTSVNSSCEAMQAGRNTLFADAGFLEKPYNYIFLFRYSLF